MRPASSESGWEDEDDEDDVDVSMDYVAGSFWPQGLSKSITAELLNNSLCAPDLQTALEAIARYAFDTAVEFTTRDALPPGWSEAKEFITQLLISAIDRFYRVDVFLRAYEARPDLLFSCLYFLCYATSGLTTVVAESSNVFGDMLDAELTSLLSATFNILDSRAAVNKLKCALEAPPGLQGLAERLEKLVQAQPPAPLSDGETDDDEAPKIHLRHVNPRNSQWQAYLVQALQQQDFIENLVKIISTPKLHTLCLVNQAFTTLSLVAQLTYNVVEGKLSPERLMAIEQGMSDLLRYIATDLLADPEKVFSGRERASGFLSSIMATCHELVKALDFSNVQVTAVQRQLVTEMLKSSNFARLLSAVNECRVLLNSSTPRPGRAASTAHDFVGIEDNVRWLDQERIVKQMLRVNLHQSQYADAVLGILDVLAERGFFKDEHLDMLWGVTEQEGTFDAVKTNVCHMIKELAKHLRPQQLDMLFSKFENTKGRSLPDTLRLLDLLRRLAKSDTSQASSMAGKLVELVWELTMPADAPPELLNSGVMLEVLEGYKQHALLQEYIQRCISQLRARQNVYTALTVLQNLLRLWGKLYGWEVPQGRNARDERRAALPRSLPEMLNTLEQDVNLSRLLVDNVCEFMASAARWLEERRGPAAPGLAGAASGPATQPPGQGSYSYQQIVRRYLDVFRLVNRSKDTFLELPLVESLWDAVVLRPNTPEDMPTGLDLVLACVGERDDSATHGDDSDGVEHGVTGSLLELEDVCRLLQDRVTRLPVENLAQPAFTCFRVCLEAAWKGLDDRMEDLPVNRPSAEAVLTNLRADVEDRCQTYAWQIVLDCQRSDVTSSASQMLIHKMYGKEGIRDMVSDTRKRLLESAALLMSVPPGTVEWERVELPADVMESSEWEQAKTRVTRCLQLLEQLAGKSEEAMPPVPMHSASWQGLPIVLELNTPDQGRIKVQVANNEYVGLLRRKVALKIGADPACVRLIVGGQELKSDSRTMGSALPASWTARQALMVQVSPRANKYTRYGDEWWAAWHRNCTLAHMYHDDQLYRVLLLLADLPKAPTVRAAATHMLQQLPTCSWVPAALLEALQSEQPAAQLRRQLLGPSGAVERPGLLLYTLQALYALLQPSYPQDLLPLAYKPWPAPQQPPQQRPQQLGGGAEPLAGAAVAAEGPATAAAAGAWWQVVAAGAAAQRLLPVLARCVPLLAEVVDRVMAPAAAAGVAVGSRQLAAPLAVPAGRDLPFVKDFQWVMVFLLCNIYSRARKGTSADGARPGSAATPRTGASRPHRADSLSSSHGPHDATISILTAPRSTTSAPVASGGQDSEAVTQEVAAGGVGGAAAAATPDVTSGEADVEGPLGPAPCSSGTAAAAAALVSGLAVSSRGSPEVHSTMAAAAAGAAGPQVDAAPAVGKHGGGAAGHGGAGAAGPQREQDVDMQAEATQNTQSISAMVLGTQQHEGLPPSPGRGPARSPVGPAPSVSMGVGGVGGMAAAAAAAAAATAAGELSLQQCLGGESLRCMVSLLVRMALDAGCLWGYGCAREGGGQQPAGGCAPTRQQRAAAVDVAGRLATKALSVLAQLVRRPELREAFLEDPRAVPMIRETLSCEFSPTIRETALAHLSGIFVSAELPQSHYMWVLRSLIALRPSMEERLGCCLEFHRLLCKVLHQLPELAAPTAEARLLADSLLADEVARLAAGAEELLEPRRGLLLQGKLMLVRELVRALDRLGLGLGANGRPGLISILLNRYLFPEAQPLWQPDATHVAMEEALQHVAGEPDVRGEALALVQCLMTGCPANLELGLRDLWRLHYENGLRATERKFDIGGEGVRPDDCYVGLRNGGATCYMNSVMQQLFMQPLIRERVLGASAVDPEEQQDSVFHQLQVMFAHLRLGRASCFHPRAFWQAFKDYDGQPIDVREHQDAYEFFTRLQDAVDSHLRSTGQPPAMHAVMGGKFAAQIICKDVNYRSEREEEFYQISVDVKGFTTLEKSLEGYVAGELMEGDNSYYCEELGARVAAVRRTVIKQLPQTLVIHLKRFEYDHLNMTRYKLRERFEFPVVLDMFRYTADGLAALEGGSSAAAGAGGGGGGSAQGEGASGSGGGGARPRDSYLYELKGIVVHSGTAFAGHYYSFIKERPKRAEDGQLSEGGWYRFDDRTVSPWNVADLDADCFGGRAAGSNAGARADVDRPYSAYMLFYERRDSASFERPAAAMRAVPKDLVMAAAMAAEAAGPAAAAAPAGVSGCAEAGGEGAAPGRGEGAAEDMETDGPAAGPARPPEAPPPSTPYGMPVLLYQAVLRDNLMLSHKLHVLNKEYFAFIRQVVEVTWESVLAGRKTRRRDFHHPGPAPMSPSTPPAFAPSPALGPALAHALASAAPSAGPGGGAEPSSAPSQRNEDLDETVLLSSRLAAAFLLNVYIPAPYALRADLGAWRDLLRSLVQASPRACVEFLQHVGGTPPLLHHYFVRNGSDGAVVADMLGWAVAAAWRAVPAAALLGGGGSGGGGAGGGAGAGAAAAGEEWVQQLQAASSELALRLCDYAFGVLHDNNRSTPRHLPVCNALAALVAHDASTARLLLQRHLRDLFSLPGWILSYDAEPDAASELADCSAALLLLHATLQYTSIAVGPEAHRLPPLPAPGGGGGGGAAAARPLLLELEGAQQVDELLGLHECGVFAAAVAHSGLLHQPHVAALARYLVVGNTPASVRLLNALLARLDDVDAQRDAGADVMAAWDAAPAALDVRDGLRPNRVFALLFGSPPLVRASLVRGAQAGVARQQTISWSGMAYGNALAVLYDSMGDAVREATGSASFSQLTGLVTAAAGLVRQLDEFARMERAPARDAATNAATAALVARVVRVGATLNALVQLLLPTVMRMQAQQQQAQAQQQAQQQAQAQQQHGSAPAQERGHEQQGRGVQGAGEGREGVRGRSGSGGGAGEAGAAPAQEGGRRRQAAGDRVEVVGREAVVGQAREPEAAVEAEEQHEPGEHVQ